MSIHRNTNIALFNSHVEPKKKLISYKKVEKLVMRGEDGWGGDGQRL
jgi:hypothetical protein